MAGNSTMSILEAWSFGVRQTIWLAADWCVVVYSAKGVCIFYKVLGKFLSVAVVSECLFVLIVPDCEASSALTHVCFIAVRNVSL